MSKSMMRAVVEALNTSSETIDLAEELRRILSHLKSSINLSTDNRISDSTTHPGKQVEYIAKSATMIPSEMKSLGYTYTGKNAASRVSNGLITFMKKVNNKFISVVFDYSDRPSDGTIIISEVDQDDEDSMYEIKKYNRAIKKSTATESGKSVRTLLNSKSKSSKGKALESDYGTRTHYDISKAYLSNLADQLSDILKIGTPKKDPNMGGWLVTYNLKDPKQLVSRLAELGYQLDDGWINEPDRSGNLGGRIFYFKIPEGTMAIDFTYERRIQSGTMNISLFKDFDEGEFYEDNEEIPVSNYQPVGAKSTAPTPSTELEFTPEDELAVVAQQLLLVGFASSHLGVKGDEFSASVMVYMNKKLDPSADSDKFDELLSKGLTMRGYNLPDQVGDESGEIPDVIGFYKTVGSTEVELLMEYLGGREVKFTVEFN